MDEVRDALEALADGRPRINALLENLTDDQLSASKMFRHVYAHVPDLESFAKTLER